MQFTIRPLEYKDYDELLLKWWKDWRVVAPSRDFLPSNGLGGYIVYDGDVPVCAGFIYNTDSNVAWCEFIVSNFDYKDKKRKKECLNLLGSKVSMVAKDAGKSYLMTMLKSKLLMDVCADQGYMKMSGGYTQMTKIL